MTPLTIGAQTFDVPHAGVTTLRVYIQPDGTARVAVLAASGLWTDRWEWIEPRKDGEK